MKLSTDGQFFKNQTPKFFMIVSQKSAKFAITPLDRKTRPYISNLASKNYGREHLSFRGSQLRNEIDRNQKS